MKFVDHRPLLVAAAFVALGCCGLGCSPPETVPIGSAEPPVADGAGQPGIPRAAARAKLLLVARYLKKFRKARKALPVERRKSPADAGVEPTLYDLTLPGKPWSLPNGLADLRFPKLPYSIMKFERADTIMITSLMLGDAATKGWTERGELRPIHMIEFIADEATYKNEDNRGYPV